MNCFVFGFQFDFQNIGRPMMHKNKKAWINSWIILRPVKYPGPSQLARSPRPMPGFCKMESGGGSGSMQMMWWPCLPKIGRGGSDTDIKFMNPPFQEFSFEVHSTRHCWSCCVQLGNDDKKNLGSRQNVENYQLFFCRRIPIPRNFVQPLTDRQSHYT